MPSWLLLLWAGLAAALVALPIARPVRSAPKRPRPLASRVLPLGFEIIVFPVLYALLFEALRRSDVVAGLALGAAHGLLGVTISKLQARRDGPHPQATTALRALLARTLYGAIFAFLYVVPTP